MAGYLVTSQRRNRKRVFVVGMCSNLDKAMDIAQAMLAVCIATHYKATIRVVDDAGLEYGKWE